MKSADYNETKKLKLKMQQNKMVLVLVLLALVSPLTLSDPINIGSGIQNRWKKNYQTFPGCGVMPGKDVDSTIMGGVPVTLDEPFP